MIHTRLSLLKKYVFLYQARVLENYTLTQHQRGTYNWDNQDNEHQTWMRVEKNILWTKEINRETNLKNKRCV